MQAALERDGFTLAPAGSALNQATLYCLPADWNGRSTENAALYIAAKRCSIAIYAAPYIAR